MDYKIIQYKAGNGKYKGQEVKQIVPHSKGIIDYERLCRLLSKNTTVGTADVKAVLAQLADVLTELLPLGYSVECGELGLFRASFSSPQFPLKEKISKKDIHNLKLVYVPKKSLKECLRNVEFEECKE